MNTIQEKDFSEHFDLNIWLKVLKHGKEQKKYFIILIFLMIAVGGIDVIFPLMTKIAIDKFIIPNNLNGIKLFSIGFAILGIVQSINVRYLIYFAGKIECGIRYSISKTGFQRLQELSFSYFDKTPIGWLMARMTSDVHKLGATIAWGLVDLVWGMTMMTGILIVMFILNWKLALTVCVILPLLVMTSMFFQKKILTSYREVKKTGSKITASYNEGITGAITTKTLVCEEENIDEFKELTSTMYQSSVKAAIFSSLYLPIIIAIGSIGMAIVITRGGNSVTQNAISYGTLVAFLTYASRFFEPLRETARIFAELQSAQASAERIISMIETEPAIVDSEEVKQKYGDILSPNYSAYEEIIGKVEFRNLDFYYNEKEPILKNLNLTINAGETVAIVGETGSGKSTLVNLACRFYEPINGQILIDDVDYKERSIQWLHSSLGYVLQSPHLFSGTIKENLAYGNSSISDEQIINASKLVNAHDFIIKMEHGYDTEVGENGGRLSTGEKQLISFARAVLNNPKILILDEATSSIDTETELAIQDAIHKVLEGRTSFIIAHRLSTIKSADRILVMKNGQITEEGTHHELIGEKGYYFKLYTNQFMEESEMEILKKSS